MILFVGSFNLVFIDFLCEAPPKIVELKIERTFFWCIKYKITGVPPVTRTWYFNNQPLNMTETIKDLEMPDQNKNDYVNEGQFGNNFPSNYINLEIIKQLVLF